MTRICSAVKEATCKTKNVPRSGGHHTLTMHFCAVAVPILIYELVCVSIYYVNNFFSVIVLGFAHNISL